MAELEIIEDCEEDVVFQGSALYEHLVCSGYESELEVFHRNPNANTDTEARDLSVENDIPNQGGQTYPLNLPLEIDYNKLVIEIAREAIDSQLMVDEDVDFLKKFLQLDEVKSRPVVPLLGWSAACCLTPLVSLSPSPVLQWLGMASGAVIIGVSCLTLRQLYLHRRILNTYRDLLASTTRLKSILNEVAK